jgi:DNA-binding XRE family transcriptional regulator
MGVHWGVSDEGTAQFLSRLWESQVATGLNDAGLARIICVNQSTIHCLKKGKRTRPSLTTALAIIRLFPDLAPLLKPAARRSAAIPAARKERLFDICG